MKKIINGKKYDTNTAEFLGENGSGNMRYDFSWYNEELYRKKSGEYFLYGEGGPMSPYREEIQINGYIEGSCIKPLTEAEAREWAEENLSVSEYEEIFGPVSEDDISSIPTITEF